MFDRTFSTRRHPADVTERGMSVWHDPRTIRSMSLVRLLILTVLCGMPHTAWAQSWAEAYKGGDYEKAADLLHPLVIQMMHQPEMADPDPARHLATMYAQGLGVPQDLIAACSLAQAAHSANQMAAPKYAQNIQAYDASIREADAFINKHCDGLSAWDRMVASVSMGCPAFGMPEEVLMLGNEAVVVGRGGIRLREAVVERPEQMMNCPQAIARVRAIAIEPPPDAAPGVVARHFVEILGWLGGQDPRDGTLHYLLQWQMYELRGKKLELATLEQFDETDRWPKPALPRNLDARLTLEMIRSGNVHWRLDGAPPKRGWIMLPEEKSR